MADGNTIIYLSHHQIDKKRWDACISSADNGLIYAYSFYLDHMCPAWDALVTDDYSAVFPLPQRKKWNICYLYQPFLVAQLGLFGKSLTPDILYAFLTAIPDKFKYWDFPLNSGNCFSIKEYPLYLRKNYILPLKKAYEELYSGYRQNVKRNIKKALQYKCTTKKGIAINDVIELAKNYTPGIDQAKADFHSFQDLYSHLKEQDKAETYGVYSSNHELIASCAFFFSNKRAYYILVGNHPNGRTLGASHLLIDTFIKDYAGEDLILDCEGSDIRNLAFFYSSFGAVEENYVSIRLNRLPWYLKWIKEWNATCITMILSPLLCVCAHQGYVVL